MGPDLAKEKDYEFEEGSDRQKVLRTEASGNKREYEVVDMKAALDTRHLSKWFGERSNQLGA